MHDMCDEQNGGALGYSDPYQGYGYGLGGIFDVITAPFKAVAKVGKFVVTKVAPVVITAATGVDLFGRAQPTPYDPGQQMYPQAGPVTDVKSQITDILNEIKNAALGGAARQIANTPEGQAAIREQAMRQAAEKAKAGAPWLIGAVVALALITMKRGQ